MSSIGYDHYINIDKLVEYVNVLDDIIFHHSDDLTVVYDDLQALRDTIDADRKRNNG